MLYTVPNNPDDQPHELFNAHVKHYVRKNAKKGRTMDEFISDIQNGAYGGITICNAIHNEFDSTIAVGCQNKCHRHEQRDKAMKMNFTVNFLKFFYTFKQKTEFHCLL